MHSGRSLCYPCPHPFTAHWWDRQGWSRTDLLSPSNEWDHQGRCLQAHSFPPKKKKKPHCRVIRGQPLQDWSFISLAEPGDNVELNKHSDLHSQRVQIHILSFRTHSAAGDHGIGLLKLIPVVKSGLIWDVCFVLFANLLTLCRNHSCSYIWNVWSHSMLITETWWTCGQCKFVYGSRYFLIPQCWNSRRSMCKK